MKHLHIMGQKRALALHVREYFSPYKCKECGEHERYMKTWSIHEGFCATCYPLDSHPPSPAKIFSREAIHNKKVEKLKRLNWEFPVVYHGMNTI